MRCVSPLQMHGILIPCKQCANCRVHGNNRAAGRIALMFDSAPLASKLFTLWTYRDDEKAWLAPLSEIEADVRRMINSTKKRYARQGLPSYQGLFAIEKGPATARWHVHSITTDYHRVLTNPKARNRVENDPLWKHGYTDTSEVQSVAASATYVADYFRKDNNKQNSKIFWVGKNLASQHQFLEKVLRLALARGANSIDLPFAFNMNGKKYPWAEYPYQKFRANCKAHGITVQGTVDPTKIGQELETVPETYDPVKSKARFKMLQALADRELLYG